MSWFDDAISSMDEEERSKWDALSEEKKAQYREKYDRIHNSFAKDKKEREQNKAKMKQLLEELGPYLEYPGMTLKKDAPADIKQKYKQLRSLHKKLWTKVDYF